MSKFRAWDKCGQCRGKGWNIDEGIAPVIDTIDHRVQCPTSAAHRAGAEGRERADG